MKNRPGTSIIEIIIATALISMAIIAALSLTNHSQKQNTYARGIAEASRYASQAADWIKTEKETLGWETINTQSAGDYCLNTIPVDFTALSMGDCEATSFIGATNFQRQITLTKSAQTINIVITVSWLEQIERQTKLEMELIQ